MPEARLSQDQLRRIGKALADPQRFALLARIAREPEVACSTLVEEFPVTQATISHHMKELETAGLISARRAGKFCYFAAQAEAVRAYQKALGALIPSRGAGRRRAAGRVARAGAVRTTRTRRSG